MSSPQQTTIVYNKSIIKVYKNTELSLWHNKIAFGASDIGANNMLKRINIK